LRDRQLANFAFPRPPLLTLALRSSSFAPCPLPVMPGRSPGLLWGLYSETMLFTVPGNWLRMLSFIAVAN